MKKLILFAATGLLLAACSNDKGTASIQLPEGFQDSTIVVSHMALDNMFNAKQAEDLKVIYDTIAVTNGKATLVLDKAGAARYSIEPPVMATMQPEFYASPGETLEVKIVNFEPLDYDVKGSKLMEDLMAYQSVINPIQQEYMSMVGRSENITPEQLQDLMKRKDEATQKFIADHPKSHALPYIITDLSADEFKPIYDNLSSEAKKSILMPFAELYNEQVEDMITEREAEEARKAEMASGTVEAANFTLPDLNGKKVSLSDFKGKWVVLDFWGSWCGWCVKGFPALKEAYQKYGDKIVVIGIDCNESEEDWREGVKQHELPWINVYNGNDRTLYEAYDITGFPTKAIVNPEGKLVDLTTGEDPSFFTRLADFVK